MVIFRGPVTLTTFAERLAVVLSLPLVCRGRDSNTQSSACVADIRDAFIYQCSIDWIVFYAGSAIFQTYNGGDY